MRNRLLVVAALAAAVTLVGCELFKPSAPPTVNVLVNQNVVVNPSGTPSPAAPTGACQPVQSLNVGIPAEVNVGASIDLSLTPFVGVGIPSPKVCDDARTVAWRPTLVEDKPCSVSVTSSPYSPTLKGEKKGVCEVTVTVDGFTIPPRIVNVQ